MHMMNRNKVCSSSKISEEKLGMVRLTRKGMQGNDGRGRSYSRNPMSGGKDSSGIGEGEGRGSHAARHVQERETRVLKTGGPAASVSPGYSMWHAPGGVVDAPDDDAPRGERDTCSKLEPELRPRTENRPDSKSEMPPPRNPRPRAGRPFERLLGVP